MPQQRARQRKNVNDCYSVDSFACGFETRASPSNSLAAGGSFRLTELRNRFLHFAYALSAAAVF